MGVPYVDAPCEAEAQCAALVKAGKVYATATEDMDALTFGSTVLLRHLTFSEARKMPVKKLTTIKCWKDLVSQVENLLICILLGCDYCEGIKGIGPKRAIELMNSYRDIETILKNIDRKKYTVPENWNFDVFKWSEPDERGLVKFCVVMTADQCTFKGEKILKSKQSQLRDVWTVSLSLTTTGTKAKSRRR
ncbi:Flap endonuclease 1 [Eumeta japonica]|uniref:Flap endonuclease 1 n=1 Tax=Eumeta variegata TaxID=151549 RepID=A0A4C1SPP1_EUMVA|nr:Flap endonuclease 1 [Eumeta japonica]